MEIIELTHEKMKMWTEAEDGLIRNDFNHDIMIQCIECGKHRWKKDTVNGLCKNHLENRNNRNA